MTARPANTTGDPVTETMLDRALALAVSGFRVFPLTEGAKTPAIDGWQTKATRDPTRIARWWRDPITGWHQDYNIGIATGGGVAVLDVDVKNGAQGPVTLRDLVRQHANLPKTLQSVTPTGGRHLLFAVREDVRNSASRIGPGLDVRGDGGYIVAPGSVVAGKTYRWADGLDPTGAALALMPDWLRGKATAPRPAPDATPIDAELVDTPATLESVRRYLQTSAPLAVQGSGGDSTTFAVAAWVRDLGVSESVALEAMLDHWNERCSPPWDPAELAVKVANAYRYAVNPQGSKSPVVDFHDSPPPPTDRAALEPMLVRPFGLEAIPPRAWILGRQILRGHVTVLVAPPGAGKSTWVIAASLAIATGRHDVVAEEVHDRCRVWYWNNEDDLDELRRRLAAAMQHHAIGWRDLRDASGPLLAMNDGTRHALKIAKLGQDGRTLHPQDRDALRDQVRAHNVGVLIVDPLVETHDADENDNRQVAQVARMYREIAKATDCAVVLIHHTRKAQDAASTGHAGNMDSGRGAGALMGVARVALTLYGMSERDAKAHGVRERERHRYVRLDDAKANLSLMSGRAKWFRRVTVSLALGGTTDEDSAVEEVGVLEYAPEVARDPVVTVDLIREVLDPSEKRAGRVPLLDVARKIVEVHPDFARSRPESVAGLIRRALPREVTEGLWAFAVESTYTNKRNPRHYVVTRPLKATASTINPP